jgi:hypothetical protein
MARQYARTVVSSITTFDPLPPKMASTVWKRTLEGLSKIKFEAGRANDIDHIFGVAQTRFLVVYEFCKGDLTKDIYRDLIHNENNMRPGELNAMFKISGLTDVCLKCSDKASLLQYFGQNEAGRTHGFFNCNSRELF